MLFDPNNPVVKRCAQGMQLEATDPGQSADLFYNAWTIAGTDLEKFIAAHYVARHQDNVQDKLGWDNLALDHALKVDDPAIKSILPSLYLNIAKCYQELNDLINAKTNYQAASTYLPFLGNDGYSEMIRAGVRKGFDSIR